MRKPATFGVVRLSAVLLAIAVVAGGCGGADTGDEETGATAGVSDDRIVGVWITESGYYKHYRADGTWASQSTPNVSDTNPWVWGTYTFDGSRFTYYTDAGSSNCVSTDAETGERSGMVGVYDVAFSEDGTEQRRTVVNDPCSARIRETTPVMPRYVVP